ncbi:VRR-NUC domain-containing protein [Salinibacter altiplanensis]|uniref:VRR-NUC domain-containing protein n=1 Tax=Salinibacter altiplanensis TaxID=1803181 RepID=UPI0018E4903E|nr:VRR-NUC domain-containing protein [Salinibacter altiplanensis]
MPDTANETLSAEEYRRGHQSEEDIHKAVVEWADRQAATEPALEMLFHVPNGGSRHIAEATKLKAMGTRQGVPDLLLPVPGPAPDVDGMHTGLALELKSPRGRLRPTQAWWLARLREQGWAVAVAWTFGEAHHTIQRYLDGEHEPQETLDLSIAEPPRHVNN